MEKRKYKWCVSTAHKYIIDIENMLNKIESNPENEIVDVVSRDNEFVFIIYKKYLDTTDNSVQKFG